MAKFGYGCISPFFLGAATTLAVFSAPLALVSLTGENVNESAVQLAIWSLLVSGGLLVPLITSVLMHRRRLKQHVETGPGNSAALIVGGIALVALLSWWPLISLVPGWSPTGSAEIAFRMAVYVGIYSVASIPTIFTRSYRTNERSIALGVGCGVILAIATM